MACVELPDLAVHPDLLAGVDRLQELLQLGNQDLEVFLLLDRGR
jgi:hypothetical protein